MAGSSSIPILNLSSTKAWPDGLAAENGEFKFELLDGNLMHAASESVDGDTFLCQCPECESPLSVRSWLLTTDCWNCRASILLSELEPFQSQTANKEATSEQNSRRTVPVEQPAPVKERRNPLPSGTHSGSKPKHVPNSSPELVPPNVRGGRKARIRRHPVPLRRQQSKWNPFRDAPSLLASLLLHLLLLVVLAMLTMQQPRQDESITLSTSVGPSDLADVAAQFVDPVDKIAYDLPVPQADQPRTENQRQSLLKADEDAKSLRMDPDSNLPELPDLFALKRAIGIDPQASNLAVRDPRLRVEMIRREGGTTLTEAAVARGLKWLATHQNKDGSWSLDRFSASPYCRGQCRGHGQTRSDTAATSLALLPFLGAGQTPSVGRYSDVVSKGLRWLIQHQKENGDLRGRSNGNAGMYAHGQSAIVLCEAYALTRDEQLRRPAEAAIEFIVYAQHPGGGWRYTPKEPGDTSVLGWQLMALQSARAAGLVVPEESIELAGHYLDTCAFKDGAIYSYRPGDRTPTHVMTAEALLCRMYMGWDLSHPALQNGVRFLTQEYPPDQRRFDLYYWYYATQVMHHVGGRPWKLWNQRIRDVLVESQEKYGHSAGSWRPKGPHGRSGGRIYTTSLAVCTLEVYYRHAPIFRRLELE